VRDALIACDQNVEMGTLGHIEQLAILNTYPLHIRDAEQIMLRD